MIVGGHLDSVPDGGWLDGTLNVVAGLEVLRALAPERRALTLKLVDWADEEGARFGRSLLGSSACAGSLDPDSVRGLTDRDGDGAARTRSPPTAWSSTACSSRARGSRAPPPTSSCTSSRGRCSSGSTCRSASCSGRSASSATGSASPARTRTPAPTPMDVRRDAFLAAARSALAFRDDAAARDDVRATTGTVRVSPGIVTAFNGTCEISLDQRALDPGVLAEMLKTAQADVRTASRRRRAARSSGSRCGRSSRSRSTTG